MLQGCAGLDGAFKEKLDRRQYREGEAGVASPEVPPFLLLQPCSAQMGILTETQADFRNCCGRPRGHNPAVQLGPGGKEGGLRLLWGWGVRSGGKEASVRVEAQGTVV